MITYTHIKSFYNKTFTIDTLETKYLMIYTEKKFIQRRKFSFYRKSIRNIII